MTSSFITQDLTVSYGDKTILNGLSLQIPKGKITTLIGPNGCGKSTLLNSLCGLLDYSGEIAHDGTPIDQLKPKDRARQIALLPQSPIAPEGLTVFQLVTRGRHPHQSWLQQWSAEDEAKVSHSLDVVGASALAQSTLQNLSGGQRQRAWIAMTLAQDTPTVLLDEPTTYLDLAHSIDILRLVRRLRQQEHKTIVMVLHDLNLAVRYSDHLIVMSPDGTIAAAGEPNRVIDAALLKQTFGLDAVVIEDPETAGPLIVPRKDD